MTENEKKFWLHRLPRFRKMVQKLVPDFNDKKQYVLWLVCDFWSKFLLYDVEGSVKLYDANDNEIDMSLFGLQHTKFLTRTPYYNKGIRQVGVKKGRNIVFGVPLVFNDYHDMLELKTIKIHWDIMTPVFLDEQILFDIRPVSIDIVYHVNFDITDIDENHWFTLSYQTCMFDEQESNVSKIAEYYDTALCVSDYHIEDDDGQLITGFECCEISSADNKIRKLSKQEKDIVTMLDNQSFDRLIQMARKYEESGQIRKLYEWDADRYYYEKSIVLKACLYAADIIPESGFGFKE